MEEYGTPLTSQPAHHRDDIHRIENAFGGIPPDLLRSEANANRALPDNFRRGTPERMPAQRRALSCLDNGFAPNKITCSGVGKRDDEIAFALEHRILAFDVESTEEIEVINQIARA
jgi:diaminopimelate decarboxylase